MLNLSELDRLYGNLHPGLSLVTYVPVAIPVHAYAVEMRIYEIKDYPLLNEHVIRCISLGMNSVDEISGFLGIEEIYVSDAVATESAENGTIGITGRGTLLLTEFGVQKLENFTQNEARRATEKLHVDLVTGIVTKYRNPGISFAELGKRLDGLEGEQFVRKLKSRSEGDKSIIDFKLDLVEELLGAQNSEKRISVLEVMGVRRSTKKPLYVLGQVLVYADSKAQNVMLTMTVDGARQLEHDQYLATPEVRDLLDFEIEPEAEELLPANILQESKKTKTQHIVDLIKRISDLPQADEDLFAEESKSSESDVPNPATIVRPSYIGPSLFRPQVKPVRLRVTDFPSLRSEAIRFSKNRLLIISPWVKKAVVNQDFIRQLTAALTRGVRVDIALGIGKDFSDSHEDSISALVDLSSTYSENLYLHKWQSHEKLLIADQAYIETTFNWLSFQGVTKQHYRRERGTLIVDSQIADEVYLEMLNEIQIERDPKWPTKR
jgi:hypothetical protein